MARLTIWFIIAAAFTSQIGAQDKNMKADSDTLWYKGDELSLYGQGWKDVEAYFDRLPQKAKKIVRKPVWELGHNSAGLYIRFTSNSDRFFVKYKLYNKGFSMAHMPSTGINGTDLYCLKNGKWIFISNGRSDTSSANIIFADKNENSEERHYMLFLPLYNGVKDFKLGIPGNYFLKKDSLYENQKPIVFHGTSITQGGCASRPGNCHTSLILRHFNRPVINLGFSGNGRMEPEVIQLVAELDAALFVIDCHKNMTVEEVRERMEPSIRKLKITHPDTPVLVIEETSIYDIYPSERGKITKEAIENLQKEGFKNIYYLPGNNLLGHDSEGTVDTIHPNDLGFSRMAEDIENFIIKNNILK